MAVHPTIPSRMGGYEDKTMTQIDNWEKEFELRFKNWQEDIIFWGKDIKDWLGKLIALAKAEERKQIVEMLEQSKRKGGDIITTILFNGEIDELINNIK